MYRVKKLLSRLADRIGVGPKSVLWEDPVVTVSHTGDGYYSVRVIKVGNPFGLRIPYSAANCAGLDEALRVARHLLLTRKEEKINRGNLVAE